MNQLSLPDLSTLDLEEAKQILRGAARTHRKERSSVAREEAAQKYIPHVLDFVNGSHRVACYVSVNCEPPTFELCTAIADSGIELLLPKLGPGLTRAWGYFRGIDDLEQMAPGRPPEPTGPAFDNSILSSVDAMIIPALLVSRAGERLGQGGGWYDRALKETGAHTRTAALIFADEYIEESLPQDDMDVPVPYAITSEGLHHTLANA